MASTTELRSEILELSGAFFGERQKVVDIVRRLASTAPQQRRSCTA